MKNLGVLISILVVLFLAACGQSANGGADESSGKRVITVGASPDGFPQYFLEDDELKGYSIDAVEAIFEKAGYEVEWYLAEWSGLVAALETGKIDTLSNFGVSPERAEKFNFSDTYSYSRVGIGVATNNDTISSFEDLKGEQVANILGSNYGEVLKTYDTNDEIELVNYETLDVIYQDVANGKVDAFVSGREYLLAQIKEKGMPLKVVGEPFGEKPGALPFKKTEENDQLIEEVNKAIEELRAEGTLTEISEKWFGEDVTYSIEG